MRNACVTIGQSPRTDVMRGMIITHCIGHTEAMRQKVMRAPRRAVLLSRRLVAHAIDLLQT